MDDALRVSQVPPDAKENYIELHMDNASEDSQGHLKNNNEKAKLNIDKRVDHSKGN